MKTSDVIQRVSLILMNSREKKEWTSVKMMD